MYVVDKQGSGTNMSYFIYDTNNASSTKRVIGSFEAATNVADKMNSRYYPSGDKTSILPGFRQGGQDDSARKAYNSISTPATTAKNQNTDQKNNPEEIKKARQENEARKSSLTFPEGLDVVGDASNGPRVVFKAYGYRRRYTTEELDSILYRIALPIPPMMTQGYNAQIDQFSGSIVADLASDAGQSLGAGPVGSAIMGALAGGAVNGATGYARGYIDNTMNNMGNRGMLSNMALASAMSGDLRRQGENIAGMIVNPRYESGFNGMGLRRHMFSFTLVPITATEQAVVKDIVKYLRISMHPYQLAKTLVHNYPDKFIIEFQDYAGNKLDSIPYIPDCFLSGFTVDYTSGRMHDDGPVQTRINMEFVEQHTMTRESEAIK